MFEQILLLANSCRVQAWRLLVQRIFAIPSPELGARDRFLTYTYRTNQSTPNRLEFIFLFLFWKNVNLDLRSFF